MAAGRGLDSAVPMHLAGYCATVEHDRKRGDGYSKDGRDRSSRRPQHFPILRQSEQRENVDAFIVDSSSNAQIIPRELSA